MRNQKIHNIDKGHPKKTQILKKTRIIHTIREKKTENVWFARFNGPRHAEVFDEGGYRILVLPQLSKLMKGVRFPLPAPLEIVNDNGSFTISYALSEWQRVEGHISIFKRPSEAELSSAKEEQY